MIINGTTEISNANNSGEKDRHPDGMLLLNGKVSAINGSATANGHINCKGITDSSMASSNSFFVDVENKTPTVLEDFDEEADSNPNQDVLHDFPTKLKVRKSC